MAQAKKGTAGAKVKRDSRPRIDAIIRHIKSGSYDEDMGMLRGAIEDRLKVRQEAVLGLVRETFGEDFTVQPKGATWPSVLPEPEAADEWAKAEQRAREQEEALVAEAGDPLPNDDDLGPDHESRSPIIGHVEPTQEAEKKNPFR